MRGITYLKMAAAGIVCCVGGPALVLYVQPDPDELFKKYNPELQRKSLAQREQRLKDHELFVQKLKEYSKSDKHIWAVVAEEEAKQRKQDAKERRRVREELERQKMEILKEQKNPGVVN